MEEMYSRHELKKGQYKVLLRIKNKQIKILGNNKKATDFLVVSPKFARYFSETTLKEVFTFFNPTFESVKMQILQHKISDAYFYDGSFICNLPDEVNEILCGDIDDAIRLDSTIIDVDSLTPQEYYGNKKDENGDEILDEDGDPIPIRTEWASDEDLSSDYRYIEHEEVRYAGTGEEKKQYNEYCNDYVEKRNRDYGWCRNNSSNWRSDFRSLHGNGNPLSFLEWINI